TALVLHGVVRQVGVRERAKRDVGLLPDPVAPLEDPGTFLRFDRLRLLLVRALRGAPIPLPVDAEIVEPVMRTVGGLRTVQRMAGRKRCRATPLAETHHAPPFFEV